MGHNFFEFVFSPRQGGEVTLLGSPVLRMRDIALVPMEYAQTPPLLYFSPKTRSCVCGDGAPVYEGRRGDGETAMCPRIVCAGLWASVSIMVVFIPYRINQTEVSFNQILISFLTGVLGAGNSF